MVKLSDKKPKASTARMRELESMVDHYRRTRLELVDALPIGVFEIDLNGKFVYANRRAFEMSGYTRMDLEKGVNAFQMFIPGEREKVRKNTQRVMRGEMLGKNEYQALRKDGVSFPVEIQSARILNHRGKAVGLRGIIEDITQRKQMEAALRNSEEKWRSLATTAPAVILMVGRDGLIRFLNRTVGEYTPENSIGTSVYKYVPPRHRKILKKNIEGVFRTGEPDSYEIIGDGPEGPGSAWYQTHVGPITSEGKVIAVTLIAHDITKRKLMEKALREQKETLSEKTSP